MLRVNLLTDQEFRDDILKLARSLLKEVGQSIIVETINKEGWLQERINTYLSSQPVYKVIESYLQKDHGWYHKPEILNLIKKLVNERIDIEIKGMTEKVVAAARVIINESVREMVKDELKKRFS